MNNHLSRTTTVDPVDLFITYSPPDDSSNFDFIPDEYYTEEETAEPYSSGFIVNETFLGPHFTSERFTNKTFNSDHLQSTLKDDLVTEVMSTRNLSCNYHLNSEMNIEKHKRPRETKGTGRQAGYRKEDQNPLKNKAGLLVGQLKSQVKNNTEFASVIMKNLPYGSSEQDLKRFLERYDKKMKTWKAIESYLAGNREYAIIVIDSVIAFLSEEHKKSFQTWMQSTTRMTEANKAVLERRKDHFKKGFQELKKKLSGEGVYEPWSKKIKN